MSHYKAYLIAPDGHHIKAVDLECVDDDAAKIRAEQMTDISNVELWEHARRIAKFGSKSGERPSISDSWSPVSPSPKSSTRKPENN